MLELAIISLKAINSELSDYLSLLICDLLLYFFPLVP